MPFKRSGRVRHARCLIIHPPIPLISRITWAEMSGWRTGRGLGVSPVHWNLAKTTEWASRKRIMGCGGWRRFGYSLARESQLCQRCNHRGCGWISSRRDMTTNGRHRLGTPVIVVRLMGCAFLRLLSQPADYDMLVASATRRASENRIHTPYHVFQAP